MEPMELSSGFSRETTIHRTADGRWFHDGELVENERLARAFDSWIERAEDGRYCLKNAINWAYITLEGAPFFVRSVRIDHAREVAWLTLSNRCEVELDPYTLREGPDGALYCDVPGAMVARFDKHAAVMLADLIDEDAEGTYVRAPGARVRPPRVGDPLHWRPGRNDDDQER
jgi:hypothetical protein